MGDLISRQDVLDEFLKISGYLDKDIIIRTYIGLNRLPSVQSERRKGRWINGICGECGYDWSKDAPISSVPNFCSNCGADMRGE